MSPTEQSDFRVMVRSATDQEREGVVERQHGAPLASDACVLVFLDGRTVGWGDDYGTFHLLPSPSLAGVIEEAGEQLLEAAAHFWDVESRS